jgi:formylglycine-generating enzyme required for sulfatase activity
MVKIPGFDLEMGKYPVKFSEYDQFCRETGNQLPYDQGWGRGDRPVINVSAIDAEGYCKWLSDKTGQTYRLPTEQEWEYSCRGGTTTEYYWGDGWDSTKANGDDLVCVTTPVGGYGYPANPFGLFDMSGNVWEWTSSSWGDQPNQRVLRGGSWNSNPQNLRSAFRFRNGTGVRYNNYGFRVARTLTP